MEKKNWFEVDKEGLAKLIEKRGKSFVIFELLSNCWDEPTTNISISLEKLSNKPYAKLTVSDDSPDGFHDLRHAYTLFAESKKKGEVSQRGRFNLGEKLVLALCEEAIITTTTGSVKFNSHGRINSKEKTLRGSILEILLRINQKEYEDVCRATRTLIPPKNKQTTFNNELIIIRTPLDIAIGKLPTVYVDDKGNLHNTIRITEVEIHRPEPGEVPFIYEMGIPVVESNTCFSINVLQKIPLSMQRDNVTPAYRKQLLKLVLDSIYNKLTPEQANSEWVSEAAGVEGISKDAVKTVAKLQFGEMFVALDPTDKESAEKAQTEGYTVISPRGISPEQREQLKKFDLLKSSSQLFPTPKPFSDDPDAPPAEYIPQSEWTTGMRTVANYIADVSLQLIGRTVSTQYVKKMGSTACFSRDNLVMTFNISSLKKEFFSNGASREINRLVLHELAHYYSSSHHHEDYYKALERLGADLLEIAIDQPNTINRYRI